MMYEIWSLGRKPAEGIEEVTIVLLKVATITLHRYAVFREAHNWIQTPTTSWLSQSYI